MRALQSKTIFLSGLNGIRTIAAFGVIISHINLSLGKYNVLTTSLFGWSAEGKIRGWMLGGHGVTMFFVLSGFLITFLLLKEYEKTGTIKIKDFYIRRILRIWPLYYLYIGLLIIVLFSSLSFKFTWLYYLTFLANVPFVLEEALPAMDHLWSISVEEQFYLFWPLLFLFSIHRKFVNIVISTILVLSIFRIYIWWSSPFSVAALYSVVNRFDCMLFGGLGAYFYHKKSPIIRLIDNKITQSIAWLIVLLMTVNLLWFFNSIIEIFLVSATTLVIIIGQINLKNRLINLEYPILSYLGKLSFGIYVYHMIVIYISSQYLHFDPEKTVISEQLFAAMIFISIVLITVVIAHLSYFYYEIKFLKFKEKFSTVKSTNSKANIN